MCNIVLYNLTKWEVPCRCFEEKGQKSQKHLSGHLIIYIPRLRILSEKSFGSNNVPYCALRSCKRLRRSIEWRKGQKIKSKTDEMTDGRKDRQTGVNLKDQLPMLLGLKINVITDFKSCLLWNSFFMENLIKCRNYITGILIHYSEQGDQTL